MSGEMPKADQKSTQETPEVDEKPEVDQKPEADQKPTQETPMGKVEMSDLRVLMYLLEPVVPEWEQFGTALHVKYDTIQEISRAPIRRDAKDKMTAVLHKIRPQLNWEDIIDTLRTMRNNMTADKLEQSHKNGLVKYSEEEYEERMLDHLSDIIPEWESFGMFMGLLPNDLDTINSDRKTPNDCLRELMIRWVRDKGNKATIAEIIRACGVVGNNELAEKLQSDKKVKKILQRQPKP